MLTLTKTSKFAMAMNMAAATSTVNKQQGKELHQLKLKLTKDPRATSVKVPTPTKQLPSKLGSPNSTDAPHAPVAKVLRLSEVLSLPVANTTSSSAPTKPDSHSPAVISQRPPATHSSAVKSPQHQQRVLMSQPVIVPSKSPKKKQSMIVTPPQLKQVKPPQISGSPVIVKSPKFKQSVVATGETSMKHKPPPLKLMVQPDPVKRQSKKSQSILPTYRVRTIMKTNIKSSTSDGPLNIGQDAVAVVSKATELFIAELMKGAHKTALECCHKEVVYSHLAKTVRKDPDRNKFLYEILPEKVLVRDYLASLNGHDQEHSPKSSH